jgi:hypothetical protein
MKLLLLTILTVSAGVSTTRCPIFNKTVQRSTKLARANQFHRSQYHESVGQSLTSTPVISKRAPPSLLSAILMVQS